MSSQPSTGIPYQDWKAAWLLMPRMYVSVLTQNANLNRRRWAPVTQMAFCRTSRCSMTRGECVGKRRGEPPLGSCLSIRADCWWAHIWGLGRSTRPQHGQVPAGQVLASRLPLGFNPCHLFCLVKTMRGFSEPRARLTFAIRRELHGVHRQKQLL